MRKIIFPWLGHEFVSLSAEANQSDTATAEAQALFKRFEQELQALNLTLNHTVRTRLWARDRESRDLGSNERVRILSGLARSASSSYIAPVHFDSTAKIAVDLLAMRPSRGGAQKIVTEYEPPIVPIRFLVYDSAVFLSGVTAVLPALADQIDNILPRITGSLRDAGSSWERVAKISFFLHRSESIETLKQMFRKHIGTKIPAVRYCAVDGYSSEGKSCEIEVTATT